MERELARERCASCLLLALVALSDALPAQSPSATLSGRIVDRASASGVPRAEVVSQSDGRRVVADSTGHYLIANLTAGTHRLLVRALGFRPVQVDIELRAGEETRKVIELDSARAETSAQELAPVAVNAPAAESYRLVDFERRRRTGRGQYRTDDEIKRSGASNLQDLTRGMRGVMQHCAARGCRIQMVRARPGCEPDYIVDGRVDNMFGSSTPIRDIVALEVYTGPSDVPGEFAGRSAGCGVIVMWTRSGPSGRH